MIFLAANTILAKRGNIGYRLAFVARNLQSAELFGVARGNDDPSLSGIASMGVIGTLSRALHHVRRRLFPEFNSRRVDIWIFNVYVLCYFFSFRRKDEIRTIWLGETSAFLATFFAKRGLRVVLDVAIAPMRHHDRLAEMGISESGLEPNLFLDKQELACFSAVTKLVVPSEYIASLVGEICPSTTVSVLPFGADFSSLKFNDVATDNPLRVTAGNRFTLGFLGNISPRKGCNRLLRAWRNVSVGQAARLVLQGNIYKGVDLISLGSSDIEVRPFGSVESFFNSIDVLVFPSLMEGSAKVIYEAVARGIPVYASRFSGAPYIDGVGIMELPVEEEMALERALKRICEDPPKRLDSEYIDKFCREFSWDVYAARYSQLLIS